MVSYRERQNDLHNLKFIEASLQSYSNAKGLEVFFFLSLIILAFVYPAFYVYSNNEHLKIILSGISFTLSIIIQIFYDTQKKYTTQGALLKEEFDIAVLQIPRKSTMPLINHTEVGVLSAKYIKRNTDVTKVLNWYPTTLSLKVPVDVSILICQRINTGWAGQLRKYYRKILIFFLCIYTMFLFYFFVINNVRASVIFLTLLSLLSFYTYLITQIRGLSSVIDKREGLSKMIDSIVFQQKDVSIQQIRDIQDEIFLTRQELVKVPNFVYTFYKKGIEETFVSDYVERVNNIYQDE